MIGPFSKPLERNLFFGWLWSQVKKSATDRDIPIQQRPPMQELESSHEVACYYPLSVEEVETV